MTRVELTVTGFRDDLQQLSARAVALCDALTPGELARRVEPGRWSIAENLEHLRVTADTYFPALDAALRRTRERGARRVGSFRLGLYGRMLVRSLEPPPLMRLPAPRTLRPLMIGAPGEALDRFLDAQRRMTERLDAADGLDLTAVRFGSPLASWVRLNLVEAFAMFNAHTRRHLWQGENVRARLGRTVGFADAPAPP
jgi:hypothetical protein